MYQETGWQNVNPPNPDTMDDVAVSAIPYPSDGHEATYMECKPLFIMADSKNKDDAFELATAFCSKEWQEAGFADRPRALMCPQTANGARISRHYPIQESPSLR